MKKILLTQGFFAIVDDEDYDLVLSKKWHVHNTKTNKHNFYARASPKIKRIGNGRKVTISSGVLMHRLILGLTDANIMVDHINQNGLDNRRHNLRIATRSENKRNGRPHGKYSKYLGVSYDISPGRKKWRVEIKTKTKRLYGGRYLTEIEAAKAYDDLAKIHYGEFANLNFKE